LRIVIIKDNPEKSRVWLRIRQRKPMMMIDDDTGAKFFEIDELLLNDAREKFC
jgi:hypothetical protein